MLAVGGEDDDADIVVVSSLLERVVQLVEKLRVLCVGGLWAIQHDTRDMCLRDLVEDMGVVGPGVHRLTSPGS